MTQARSLINFFDRAEQAVRAVPEGAAAQFLPIVGQTARALGYDIPGTSEAEVLRGITNQLAALQRVPGSGATTDFEMRLFMQAVPRLGNTREGNLQLLDLGRLQRLCGVGCGPRDRCRLRRCALPPAPALARRIA